MSYIINNSRGQLLVVVPDGTVNTTATDLSLVGRGVTEYGTAENENYVYLLENFANSTAPLQPILGQLWYNSSTDEISTYNTSNTWSALASQTYVQAQKVSPVFTGTPTAPTAANGTSTTQIATTAFVLNQLGGSNSIVSVGNITGGNLLTAGIVSAGGSITSGGNITGGNILTAGIVSATGNVHGANFIGNVISPAGSNVSTTGNVSGGNILTTGLISATSNITGGNIRTSGVMSATGNVTGNYILGNGALLTGVITSVGNISSGTSNVTVDSTNGNVSINIAGVANVGLFTSSGLAVGGNITAGNVSYSGNIVSNGVGTPTVTSTTNLDLEAPVAVRVTGGGTFRLPTLTQVEINALSPSAGDMVYNLTINSMQVYQYLTGASSLSWVTVTEARYQ